MPIRMHLAGRSFDPKLIQNMSGRFHGVCTALRLRSIDGAVTRLVAEKIIELAGGGTRTGLASLDGAQRVPGLHVSASGLGHITDPV